MKEVKTTMNLESGNWKMNIFEIGNTYQIYAENGDKVVHFMINKRDYLKDLLEKQNGGEVKENHGITCTGRELLTQSEFNNMKKILFEHMDADLSEEKFVYGIIPDKKPD
jgi:hypothetical protein